MAFGNNSQTYKRRQLLLAQTNKFTQDTLDSVALRGIAAFFAYRRAQLPGRLAMRLKANEDDKIFRKKSFTLGITGCKIRPRAQSVLSPKG